MSAHINMKNHYRDLISNGTIFYKISYYLTIFRMAEDLNEEIGNIHEPFANFGFEGRVVELSPLQIRFVEG